MESSVYYRVMGDSLHILNLLNIALYGTAAFTFMRDPATAILQYDEAWLEGAGFCIPHETTEIDSGNLLVMISLLGFALRQYVLTVNTTKGSRKISNMSQADSLMFFSLLGALGHAFGHYFIAYGKFHQFYPPATTTFMHDLLQSTPLEAAGKALPGLFLFWIPLFNAYMRNTTMTRIVIISLISWFSSLFTQVRFGFSFAQSVLFGGMSLDQLLLPNDQKGFEYALWPLITVIPNGILGWYECMRCSSSFLMKEYGHAVYDTYMAASYLLYYVICWARSNAVIKTKTL